MSGKGVTVAKWSEHWSSNKQALGSNPVTRKGKCGATRVVNFSTLSLRFQTSCYTADYSTTFLYMLKTKTFFARPIRKPPAGTLEFKNFDFILQKISVILDKNGKSSPPCPQLASPVPGQAYGLRRRVR